MRQAPLTSKKAAEKLFKRKASPDSNLSVREFLKKKSKKKVSPKVINKAPGELYNAQRAKYQKAMNSAMKKGGSSGIGVGY